VALALALTPLAASASGATDTLAPPVIRETFTALPCNHSTTVGLEGCAEGQLLTTDHRLNVEVALVFRELHTTAQRRSFVESEKLWFSYRVADCQSDASVYQGGTLAPVEFAQCEVLDNESRSSDLHGHYALIVQGNAAAPAWP
jgi:uncharacterized protein YecT (DUF1311 family)